MIHTDDKVKLCNFDIGIFFNLVPRVLSLPPSRKYPGFGWSRAPLSKQLPTRVDSLFFKKRREKRMQIFSNWHEDRGMKVISSIFLNDRDAEKIYSLLSQRGVSEVQIMRISHQQNILR